MNVETSKQWNEALWLKAEAIYEEAFPEHGRKTRTIVRRMLEREIAALHVWSESNDTIAMALTAFDTTSEALIIDYLAVRRSCQGLGIGQLCIRQLSDWALRTMPGCRGMIIEAEAEQTPENASRIRFWKKAGFTLTDYIHHYIWVPETYHAMVLSFHAENPLTHDGKALFKAITRYHEKAYRSKG
ncbi:GNAT family N-acetyltransferase [Paenibacillus sp. R14(2021)]|uniref:GNAT family N-acetyltransferase n=1 Tax=Paenibacillus sp. R14(2021) TaxID=2859228 RepID=UPI001C6118AB|nr:GNAT family N-acetyltransferase [Paenibacillus sp. R14(2021)]